MEEAIEIINKYLDKHERQYVSEEKNKLLTAIENIIARLEQDERVIEEMAWHLHIVWDGFAEKEDVIDHFRKKCE